VNALRENRQHILPGYFAVRFIETVLAQASRHISPPTGAGDNSPTRASACGRGHRLAVLATSAEENQGALW